MSINTIYIYIYIYIYISFIYIYIIYIYIYIYIYIHISSKTGNKLIHKSASCSYDQIELRFGVPQ